MISISNQSHESSHVPGFTFFQTSSIYRRRGSRFFLLPTRLPCPQLQKARHIHAVDLVHGPAVLQQRVVGGIEMVWTAKEMF